MLSTENDNKLEIDLYRKVITNSRSISEDSNYLWKHKLAVIN